MKDEYCKSEEPHPTFSGSAAKRWWPISFLLFCFLQLFFKYARKTMLEFKDAVQSATKVVVRGLPKTETNENRKLGMCSR